MGMLPRGEDQVVGVGVVGALVEISVGDEEL
jgi:hypothetical protein